MNALTLKRAALAVALATAASAFAAPTNGDLILQVYDSASGTTYTRDLGVLASAFTDTAGQTFSTDSLFGTFLTGKNAATLVWNVSASNPLPSPATASDIVWATDSQSPITTNSNTTQVGKTWTAVQGVYTLLAGKGTASSYISTSADAGTNLDFAFENLAGALLISTDATGLGSSLGFAKFTNSRTATALSPFSTTFTLAADGTLSYGATAAPAVPEPGTWALFAAGLLTFGAIARRRAA